jgi:alpha-tubulin suppressor-like RCC1 family protein
LGACALVTSVTTALVTLDGGRPASGLASTTQSIAYAWGSNTFGQLGNGTAAASSALPSNVTTTAVSGANPGFTQIASGGLHTVAIGTDGHLYAWGANEFGQLGQGPASTGDLNTPHEITLGFPSGTTFKQVAAGSSFSLALTAGGSIYAWGSNTFGQLGDGNTTDSSTPTLVSTPGGVTFKSIAAGSGFALALSTSDTVYSWGDNGLGQLGDGSTSSSKVPVQLPSTDFAGPVTQVSAGASHALALVGSTGKLYGWGDDASGQLGDGNYTDTTTPVAVNAPPSGSWSSMSAGSDFTVGLTSNGAVFAWGDNQFGQLGDGDVAQTCNVGDTIGATVYCSNTPVQVLVPPSTQFVAVAAGYGQAYALAATGAAWSWGDDGTGQLGNNGVGDAGNPTDAPATTPVQVTLPSGTNASAVFSGSQSDFGFLITGLDQSFTSGFPAENKQYGFADFLLPAPSVNTGLPVSVTSTTGAVCGVVREAQPGEFLIHIGGAGTCSLTASQSGSDLYNPAQLMTNYQIAQVPLTVTANNVTSSAGVIPSSFSYSISGFVNGDTQAVVSGTASCRTPATTASPPGSYPINCSAGSLSAANYSFTNFVAGTLTLTKRATPTPLGYHLVASDGGIFSFGNAQFFGSTGAIHLNKPIVGIADTPDATGYWMVASDGGIFSYGGAQFYGSTGAIHLNQPIVGMTPTPDGGGYWLVASDGGIFAFGDAGFYGSTGAIHLNRPIVGMTATSDGRGYWLVASDGGIFAFGDAGFYGSTGAIHLNKPIVGMASTPDGGGYWMVASDGGIFTFGDAPFEGSAGGDGLASPVVGMERNQSGNGYWLATAAGGVYGFGSPFYGSLLGLSLNAPITGIG